MLIAIDDLQNHDAFDVVVVGAGMVGASAAISLAQLNLNVLLLDAFPFRQAVPEYSPSYDERSTALSWGTRQLLEGMHVWESILHKACPIEEVHVSEKGGFGSVRMHSKEYRQEALGYVVANQWLGHCLLSRVDALNIPLCSGVKVADIVPGRPTQIQLISTLSGQVHEAAPQSATINARLLIIADGSCSETARKIGIDYQEDAYRQHAIVANITTELPNQGRAFERFTPTGPLALLPLSENQSALVWTHDQTQLEQYLAMSEQQFCRAIEDSFGERLGAIVHCGERASYPLKLIQAKEQCRDGILLLGNAAHSLHPVAGQGFNLAIRGVAACAEHVLKHRDSCFEALEHLITLCEQLQADQQKTIALSDQLVKVFGSSSKLLGFLREAGLVGLDNTAWLKSIFAARAMGLAERKIRLN